MDIREYREYKAEDVLRLYASVGWNAASAIRCWFWPRGRTASWPG